MSVLSRNITANVFGRGWGAILQLVSVPIFIKILGIEAFGLLGLFMSIQIIASVLDFGLSPLVTRELARLSSVKHGEQESRNLVRTFEIIYWGIAVLLFLCIFTLAPLIAKYWIRANTLSVESSTQAFRLLAIYMMFQWPVTLYSAGLMGLQAQVLLNLLNISFATMRTLGGIVALLIIAPDLEVILLWNVVCVLCNVIVRAILLWQKISGTSGGAKFDKDILLKVWRFCAGVGSTTMMTIVLTQTDKVVLSKMVSLKEFGYYSLAATVAAYLAQVVSPISTAVFPRLSQLVGANDCTGLRRTFHASCQLVSVFIFPVSMILIFFSEEILLLWTKNVDMAKQSHLLMALLVTGSALNAMMIIPFNLQYAEGRTRFVFLSALCGVILYLPSILYLVSKVGIVGAGIAWIGLNLGFVAISAPYLFKYSMPEELMTWYRDALILPIFAALLAVLLVWFGTQWLETAVLFNILMGGTIAVGVSVMAVPFTRHYILEKYERFA